MNSNKTFQILNPDQFAQSNHRMSTDINKMIQNFLVENFVKIVRFLNSFDMFQIETKFRLRIVLRNVF